MTDQDDTIESLDLWFHLDMSVLMVMSINKDGSNQTALCVHSAVWLDPSLFVFEVSVLYLHVMGL